MDLRFGDNHGARMSDFIENLVEFVEHGTVSRTVDADLKAAVSVGDQEALELVSRALEKHACPDLLEDLWQITDGTDNDTGPRMLALRGVKVILEEARRDKTSLKPKQIDKNVDRILAVYRDEKQPELLRRRALEYAAMVVRNNAIKKAAATAFESQSSGWVATSLFVTLQQDPKQGRELALASLSHADIDVRIEALSSLREVCDESDLEALQAVIDEAQGRELAAALWAVSGYDSDAANKILMEAVRWFDGSARDLAKQALGIQVRRYKENAPERPDEPAARKMKKVFMYVDEDEVFDEDEDRYTD
jgi:hypothetical protein